MQLTCRGQCHSDTQLTCSSDALETQLNCWLDAVETQQIWSWRAIVMEFKCKWNAMNMQIRYSWGAIEAHLIYEPSMMLIYCNNSRISLFLQTRMQECFKFKLSCGNSYNHMSLHTHACLLRVDLPYFILRGIVCILKWMMWHGWTLPFVRINV